MQTFDYRIPGADFVSQLYMQSMPNGELELEVYGTTDDAKAIVLSPHGIKELRLALARYERQVQKDD